MPEVKVKDALKWDSEFYPAGSTLTVDQETAARWEAHGIAQIVPEKKAEPKKPAEK